MEVGPPSIIINYSVVIEKVLKNGIILAMSSGFTIKTKAFEGPLDLLLSLVEKRKLFINDISLAAVADDYISYLQRLQNLPIGHTANFILIASTLVLIKSKSLLPTLKLTEEEEASIEDLEQRLKAYQRIKELSIYVKDRFGKNIMFQRNPSRRKDPVFSPDKKTDIKNLFLAIKDVVKSLPKKEIIPQTVVRKVISLEKVIENLTTRIQSSLSMSFKEFAGVGKKEKVEIVVGFLAMLELVKQGAIDVMQRERYGDINMESKEVGVPKYM